MELLDVAASAQTANQIFILTNSGIGNLSLLQTLTSPTGSTIQDIQAVDLDQDGNLDLVHNITNSGVGIWYGNGAGIFSGRQTYAVAGTYETDSIKLNAGGASIASGSYLRFYDSSGFSYVFWFSVGGAGAAPGVGTFEYKVSITAFDSATTVASTLSTSMSSKLSGSHSVTYDFSVNISVVALSVGNRTNSTNTVGGAITLFTTDGAAASSMSGVQVTGASNVWSLGIIDMNNDGALDIILNQIGSSRSHLLTQRTSTAPHSMDVSSSDKANRLISTLDEAIERISSRQAHIAALHSQLDFAMEHSLLMQDAYRSAEENITEADTALEVAELTRQQILQQAQVAVFAQQNLQLKMFLELLR